MATFVNAFHPSIDPSTLRLCHPSIIAASVQLRGRKITSIIWLVIIFKIPAFAVPSSLRLVVHPSAPRLLSKVSLHVSIHPINLSTTVPSSIHHGRISPPFSPNYVLWRPSSHPTCLTISPCHPSYCPKESITSPSPSHPSADLLCHLSVHSAGFSPFFILLCNLSSNQ